MEVAGVAAICRPHWTSKQFRNAPNNPEARSTTEKSHAGPYCVPNPFSRWNEPEVSRVDTTLLSTGVELF